MSNTRRQKSAKSSHNRRTASHREHQLPRHSHSIDQTAILIERSTTRLIGVWIVLGLGALSLIFRLGWLQIVDAPHLLAKARLQQSVTVRPFVPRRTIVDRSNNQMAIDRPSYTIYAHPAQFSEFVPTPGSSKSGKKVKVEPLDLAQRLAPILEIKPAELLAKFQQHKTGILLGKALPAEIENRIRALKVDGLDIRQGKNDYTRFYPQGDAAAEVLGYLDGEHKAQAGIEYSQSLLLERKVSEYKLTQTAKKSILPDRVTPDFLHADDLQLKLTLDLRLQRAARQALLQKMHEWNAPRGSVIVMDAETGALRSLVVEPTYDPNHYARDIDKAKSTALLRNWAVSDLYEPGSTFKPIAVAIGLENGIVKPDSTFFDGGSIAVGKDIIRNADLEGNGTLDTAQILQHSSNVGMVKMMQRLKPNVYHNWLQWIGLGQKSGIDLPFEERGEVRSQKEFIGSPIYPANASFGQGFSMTPIQLTTLVGSLANGGKLVTPYVVEGLFDSEGVQKDNPTRPKPRQIFSPTNAKAVLEMMETVVTKGSGLYAQIPGYRIAGKTGTSQKAGIGGYTQDDKKIASFVGILPVDGEHRYLVFAAIDEPHKGKEKAFGSNVAAPVVKSVMESLISIEGIPPSMAIPPISPNQVEPEQSKEPNKL
jgi:cell division protein FtsI (penicillin-binding protein 3)